MYLPGLNTVRFYAALSVVVVHVTESYVPGFLSGWNAVSLFFVLSGYLITYRLLSERRQRGHIDLKAFYVRRELRILPLYFLCILVAGAVLPLFGAPSPTMSGVGLAVILAPQFARAASDTALGLMGHLWSIGVEEWFYITFPFLMRRLPFVPLCLTVITASTLIGGLAWAGADERTFLLVKFMRFECMAIGALTAWAVLHRSRWLGAVYHPAVQAVVLFTLACVAVLGVTLPLHDLTFAIAAAAFLTNISTNPRSLVHLEWRYSRTLGDLTYGVYIWHFPIIWVLGNVVAGMWLLSMTVACTLIVAAVSYRYIEAPFLRLKDHVARPVASAHVQ